MQDKTELGLGFYFNNNYERNQRHRDTYFIDDPDMQNNTEKILQTQKRNNYQLIEDTIAQLNKISQFLSLSKLDDIWTVIDPVFTEVETYNLINDIDKYIELVYIKQANAIE